FNNTVSGYSANVNFSSSDGLAVLPGLSAMTGSGTFSATLKTSGGQTITATDLSAITGTSSSIQINPAAVTHFAVTGNPSSVTAGTAFSVAVTAKDAFNNTNAGYSGTVSLSSTDGQFVPPASQALVSGTTTFSGNVTLNTAGAQ